MPLTEEIAAFRRGINDSEIINPVLGDTQTLPFYNIPIHILLTKIQNSSPLLKAAVAASVQFRLIAEPCTLRSTCRSPLVSKYGNLSIQDIVVLVVTLTYDRPDVHPSVQASVKYHRRDNFVLFSAF